MIGAGLCVKQLKSGNWKVCIWGQADGHVSDWCGCNFRIKTVKGQPHKGFATKEEAEEWGRSQFVNQGAVQFYGERAGDGSHMGDNTDYKWDTVALPKGEVCKACVNAGRGFISAAEHKVKFTNDFGRVVCRHVCSKHLEELKKNETLEIIEK